MRNRILAAICFALCGCLCGCHLQQKGTTRFPDSDLNHPPPASWNGPRFLLSQDYPETEPPAEAHVWDKIDFNTQPKEYLAEVLRYIYEGNIEVDWAVQKNAVRHWFHAPWMHAPEIKQKGVTCRDEKGREFVHGLTRERATSLAEINFGQDTTHCVSNIENWAVSIYNAPGGYVIGRLWHEMIDHRGSSFPDPKKFPKDFPYGTVVAKLLFTAATESDVPFLSGSPEWQADIKRDGVPVIVRLLQVDVAVRDKRAESSGNDQKRSGWVFGTFIYDKDTTPIFDDTKDSTRPWRKVKPIGLIFGNDLNQTVLVDPAIKLTQHLGCQERLVGPVDNLSTSCLSCHAMAEIDAVQPFSSIRYDVNGFARYQQCRNQADVQHWFRTLAYGEAFTEGGVSLNLSLQLSNGIIRYCQEKKGNCPPDKTCPPTGTCLPDNRLYATDAAVPCPPDPAPTECPIKQTGEQLGPSPNNGLPAAVESPLTESPETSRDGDVEELKMRNRAIKRPSQQK